MLEGGSGLQVISELLGNNLEVCRKRYAHRADRSNFNTAVVAAYEAGAR